jgi:hypothetical protein
MNKKQTQRALQILSELHDADLPSFMDNGDASIVCEQYGVTNTRFHRASNTNNKLVNLAQIAGAIAQKENN